MFRWHKVEKKFNGYHEEKEAAETLMGKQTIISVYDLFHIYFL